MNRIMVTNILEELQNIHAVLPDVKISHAIQVSIDTIKKTNNTHLSDISEKELYTALSKFKERELKKRGISL